MNIAIILDNPRRDLRGVVLLAYQLAKANVKVTIVPMYQQGYDLPLLAPDTVVLNYIRENNRELVRNYRAMGIRIAVLDTEGGVLSENGLDSPLNWAKSLHDTKLSALVDDYYFWGEKVHDAFRTASGLDKEQLKITGCPRYDLCSQPWQQVLDYPRKGHILVNTNFSAINPKFTRSADSERKIFKSLGWESNYVDQLFDELETVFPRYIDAIANIAQSMPNTTIQVRPHPFENAKTYRQQLKSYKNVIVDGQGDVLNAIANAECIVHLNCGSAVETVRLGKIPVSLEFLNTETMRRHAPLPSTLSCHANNPDDLIALLKDANLREQRFQRQPAEAIITPWYHDNDGHAAERVATNLLTHSSHKSPPRRNLTLSLQGGRNKASTGQRLLGFTSLLLGSHAAAWLREHAHSARSNKRPNLASIAELLKQFALCESSKQTFSVHHARNPYTRLPLTSIEIHRV